MRYMDAYRAVFRNPSWMSNVLQCTLCVFIPGVGPIVLLGYFHEQIERMEEDPDCAFHDFQFSRFGDMLQRGVWPFLVAMAASMVMVPVIVLMQLGFVFGLPMFAFLENDAAAGAAAIGIFAVFFVVMMVFGMVINIAMVPMILRAGITQEFASAFDLGYIRTFIGNTWKEMIMAWLFVAATAIPLFIIGALMFCIGIYVTMTITMFAQGHLLGQLYLLNISRGGERVPRKGEPPPLDDSSAVSQV
jgi:hypothetical protein